MMETWRGGGYPPSSMMEGWGEGGGCGLWDRTLGKAENHAPHGPCTGVTAGPVSDRFAVREDSPLGRLAGVRKWAVCSHTISQPLGSGIWVLQTAWYPEEIVLGSKGDPRDQG